MKYTKGAQLTLLYVLILTYLWCPQVLESMSRVDRILTSPGGSVLMAGRSGVGRRTAISVVANLHGIRVVSPPMSLGYNIKNFRNDLKQVGTGQVMLKGRVIEIKNSNVEIYFITLACFTLLLSFLS